MIVLARSVHSTSISYVMWTLVVRYEYCILHILCHSQRVIFVIHQAFNIIFIYSEHFLEFKMQKQAFIPNIEFYHWNVAHARYLYHKTHAQFSLSRELQRRFFWKVRQTFCWIHSFFFQLYQFSQLKPIYRNLCLSRLNELTAGSKEPWLYISRNNKKKSKH